MEQLSARVTSFVLVAAASVIALLTAAPASAQLATRVPSSITTTIGEFTPIAAVANLSLGITSATDSSTTFPYETTTQFTSSGIGYISQFGLAAGTLTFNFPQPVSISHLYVWNAYFTIELDHSINQVEMTFFDVNNSVLTTWNTLVPIATIGDLTAYSSNLTLAVNGVSKVEMNVQTLHGGNEISLRRIAFAGPAESNGIADAFADSPAPAYPCPATDAVTIPVPGARSVVLLDASGREVAVQTIISSGLVQLAWQGLASGTYFARITTHAGLVRSAVVVQ
ncbi:MAG: T9SS type A sorting domain-containing protein [Flavobacteriales bacterium]|nr:T9SS type A sorting domain-containing protein [Flavobacteriales bacterium]